MIREDGLIAGAEGSEQAGGALDIGEDECDGSPGSSAITIQPLIGSSVEPCIGSSIRFNASSTRSRTLVACPQSYAAANLVSLKCIRISDSVSS